MTCACVTGRRLENTARRVENTAIVGEDWVDIAINRYPEPLKAKRDKDGLLIPQKS